MRTLNVILAFEAVVAVAMILLFLKLAAVCFSR